MAELFLGSDVHRLVCAANAYVSADVFSRLEVWGDVWDSKTEYMFYDWPMRRLMDLLYATLHATFAHH